MWSPKGQQVMISTPGQPKTHYGLGAVNYHTGESVVLIRRRKRRKEVAELLQALLDKHPNGTIFVAWDNFTAHQDDEVEAVVRSAGTPTFFRSSAYAAPNQASGRNISTSTIAHNGQGVNFQLV